MDSDQRGLQFKVLPGGAAVGVFGKLGAAGGNVVDRPMTLRAGGASGSLQSSAKLRTPGGTSLQASDGNTSSPS